MTTYHKEIKYKMKYTPVLFNFKSKKIEFGQDMTTEIIIERSLTSWWQLYNNLSASQRESKPSFSPLTYLSRRFLFFHIVLLSSPNSHSTYNMAAIDDDEYALFLFKLSM